MENNETLKVCERRKRGINYGKMLCKWKFH